MIKAGRPFSGDMFLYSVFSRQHVATHHGPDAEMRNVGLGESQEVGDGESGHDFRDRHVGPVPVLGPARIPAEGLQLELCPQGEQGPSQPTFATLELSSASRFHLTSHWNADCEEALRDHTRLYWEMEGAA